MSINSNTSSSVLKLITKWRCRYGMQKQFRLFGCKYLKHYYYSTGNMDCKLKGHITLGFGDDMGCDKYESND